MSQSPRLLHHRRWPELSLDDRAACRKKLLSMPQLSEWLADNREVWQVLSFVVDIGNFDKVIAILSPGEIAVLLLEELQAVSRARFRAECGIKDGREFKMVQEMDWRQWGESMKAYIETEQSRRGT